MKKLLVLIVLSLYITSSIGVCISLHFCGGKRTSTTVLSNTSPKCPCGSEKMKSNCCKDKRVTFTIDDYQKNESSIIINFKPLLSLVAFTFPTADENYELQDKKVISFKQYPPPDNYQNPLYILNQVFLI